MSNQTTTAIRMLLSIALVVFLAACGFWAVAWLALGLVAVSEIVAAVTR